MSDRPKFGYARLLEERENKQGQSPSALPLPPPIEEAPPSHHQRANFPTLPEVLVADPPTINKSLQTRAPQTQVPQSSQVSLTQVPQSSEVLQSTSPRTNSPQFLATQVLQTQVPQTRVVKGELRIPNTIVDSLLPQLDPYCQLVYMRLYRLSHGFRQETCVVGFDRLAKSLKLSEKTVKRAVEKLETMTLINREGAVFGGKNKGNIYRIYLPEGCISQVSLTQVSLTQVSETQDRQSPEVSLTPNKHDHDDHDLKINHHQSATVENPSGSEKEAHDETTMIVSSLYEKLTGRRWRASDSKALAGVKSIGAGQLEQAMRTIHARSAQPIGSFAYFAKAIQAEREGKGTQPHAGLRKKYEKMIREIRALHVGSNDYRVSDLIHDLKSRCAREGVTWNDDIANDVLGI